MNHEKIVKGYYTEALCVENKYKNPYDQVPYISYEIHVPTGHRQISIIGRGRTKRSAWNRAFEFTNRRILEKLEK